MIGITEGLPFLWVGGRSPILLLSYSKAKASDTTHDDDEESSHSDESWHMGGEVWFEGIS